MAENEKAKNSGRLTRRSFVKLGAGAALGMAGGIRTRSVSAAGAKDRPNLLVIMTDQQHFDTIAASGCRHVRTPATDALVNRGTSFQISYTANPLCSPARSSILTGRTPCENGVHVNGKPIRSTIPNLGQWLGEKAGYEAVYAGKWHLPRSYQAEMPGFRVLHTGIGGAGYLCDSAVSMACEAFLRNRKSSRPFLMFASFMQPHDICEWLRLNMRNQQSLRYPELAGELPPIPDNFEYDRREPAMLQKIRRGNEPAKGRWGKEHWRFYMWSYYRHIEMVDGEIGRILGTLHETGLDENTLVLFTSDHGEGMAHHQMVRKSSPYDEASRVPMVLAYPGRIPAGKTDATHLVSGLDVMPTFCDYAGIEPPAKMRGKSLRPVLEGRDAGERRFIVTESNADAGRVVRTRRYKYITYRDDPVEQLFDMKNDPGETKNLARSAEYSEIVAEHRALLREREGRLEVAPNVPKSKAWWRRA